MSRNYIKKEHIDYSLDKVNKDKCTSNRYIKKTSNKKSSSNSSNLNNNTSNSIPINSLDDDYIDDNSINEDIKKTISKDIYVNGDIDYSKFNRLTNKQKLFCEEYIIDLNSTRAAQVAYNTTFDRAKSTGSENLSKPAISEYLKYIMAKKNNQRIATQNEVLETLTALMRGEYKQETVAVVSKGIGFSEAQIITTEPPVRDRIRATELMAKRYGLLTENITISEDKPIIKNSIEDLDE